MGVVNVTPDSFSDGGLAYRAADAVRRGKKLLSDGADILDVGGESTRPGAAPVGEDEELARVIPVISRLAEAAAEAAAVLSVDTRKAAVMEAALQAGAEIINDITALTGDRRSIEVAAAANASVILMHMQGEPGAMQENPTYADAAAEVFDYLAGRVGACEAAGIPRARIAVDPGIGFGKTLDHNLEILNQLDRYLGIGCPVVLGVSRKSFIGMIDEKADAPAMRLGGSLAAALAGVARGASILRVHDVFETRQALAVWGAVNKGMG
jgi:dihydropteroate synthase